MRALLRRPRQATAMTLEYADLRLDRERMSVERAGQRISLTAKEFALLEYLMARPGHILTKDMLMQHVWDYDADILPNTVEVYVGYLRGKIDKPFAQCPALIHTKRGFGYYFGEAQ